MVLEQVQYKMRFIVEQNALIIAIFIYGKHLLSIEIKICGEKAKIVYV